MMGISTLWTCSSCALTRFQEWTLPLTEQIGGSGTFIRLRREAHEAAASRLRNSPVQRS